MPHCVPGSADAEVAQALAQPAEHLVAEVGRFAEGRVLGVELLEALLVGGEAEEVVRFLQPLRLEGRVVGAAPVDELLVGLEFVAAGAEPAGVDALVDVAVGLRAAHHLGRCDRVIRIGRADEPIEADVEAFEGRLPGRRPGVDQLVRVDPELARVALDVGRVLVETGEEARSPCRAAAGSARSCRRRWPRTASAAPAARSGRRSRW